MVGVIVADNRSVEETQVVLFNAEQRTLMIELSIKACCSSEQEELFLHPTHSVMRTSARAPHLLLASPTIQRSFLFSFPPFFV